MILLSVSAYTLAGELTKPKPLTSDEKAEIYKLSAKRHAVAAQMAQIRELYAQKLNEELGKLRAQQQEAEGQLGKLLDAKTVEGFSLDDDLNYVEKPKIEKK